MFGGIENIWVYDCYFDGGEVFIFDEYKYCGMGNIVFIKINECCGGFVWNIIVECVNVDIIGGGVLVIDIDVFY